MAIWRPTDSTPLTPLRTPFGLLADSVEADLDARGFTRYATKTLMDANATAADGTHATVYADGTPANNGDYFRDGTKWGLATGDTGDLPLSLTSGWSGAVTYRVKNGYVSLNGRPTATSGAGVVLATLPVGARPGAQITGVAFDASLSVWHTLIIGTDGSLNLFTKSGVIGDLRLGAVAPFPVAP